MKKVAILGCGNMGSSLAKGLAKGEGITLACFDRYVEKSQALAKTLDATFEETVESAVSRADFVILAIKPSDLPSLASHLSLLLGKKTILVSVLGGVSGAELKGHFPHATVVRAMPNLAVSLSRGVTGFVEDPSILVEQQNELMALFAATGTTIWVPEDKIAALTALTGCAPAFVAYLIEAFVEGGIYMGFSPQQALPLVLRVIEGTLALMSEEGLHPASLRWQVASPGGSTIEGLKVFEEHRVHYAIMQALAAAKQKS